MRQTAEPFRPPAPLTPAAGGGILILQRKTDAAENNGAVRAYTETAERKILRIVFPARQNPPFTAESGGGTIQLQIKKRTVPAGTDVRFRKSRRTGKNPAEEKEKIMKIFKTSTQIAARRFVKKNGQKTLNIFCALCAAVSLAVCAVPVLMPQSTTAHAAYESKAVLSEVVSADGDTLVTAGGTSYTYKGAGDVFAAAENSGKTLRALTEDGECIALVNED